MQAQRGAAADVHQKPRQRAGRVVVVKALVDQATQRAALLLADSSCLLVSLSGPSRVVPITVPSPVTEACFLRLQAYGSAGTASSASGVGCSIWNGFSAPTSTVGSVDDGEVGSLKVGTKESSISIVQELLEKESVGTLRGGSGKAKDQRLAVARKELFVVTAQPAKGGSCTDLRAFSCTDSAFACADIELELGGRRVRARDYVPSSRACARLDAPHGLAVKMAASINLLIVYSSSAGKFWVMAGKWFDRKGGPAQTLRAEDIFGADGYERTRLVLMKRAVVSCQAPVYSIHVSPLHLFLGENTGVRVWKLRPLIKPTSSGRSRNKLKSRARGTSAQSSHQSSEKLDCELRERGERESDKAIGKIDVKKIAGNGIHSEDNANARDIIVDTAMKDLVKRSLHSSREHNVTASVAGLGTHRQPNFGPGSYSRVNDFEFRSLSELQASLKMDLSLDTSSVEDEISAKTTMENKSNYSYASKTAPRPRNGFTPVVESQLVASHLVKKRTLQQSSASVQETGSKVLSITDSKELDSAGVCFVPVSGEDEVAIAESTSRADPRLPTQLQVVDIQAISLNDYIALDSKGALHLLTMNEVSEEQNIECLGRTFLTIRHLQSTMRVTSFAVLPLPLPLSVAHRNSFSPTSVTVKRKLWISDGMYTVHVVVFPEEKLQASIDSATAKVSLEVSQAVFMKDRVDGLVARSPDAVAVLTKGMLSSYVMPGC